MCFAGIFDPVGFFAEGVCVAVIGRGGAPRIGRPIDSGFLLTLA